MKKGSRIRGFKGSREKKTLFMIVVVSVALPLLWQRAVVGARFPRPSKSRPTLPSRWEAIGADGSTDCRGERFSLSF